MESSIEVRKVAQDVVRFVWFKHGIIQEVPLRLTNLLPHIEIMPEFSNNLSIAVWVETFQLDFMLRRYLETLLIRLTSSAKMFANYVSHIFYALRTESQLVYEQFFYTLSIATYFGLRCWENGSKAFLHTTVELFCAFYEKELRGKFEDQGSWNDFNAFLESNFELPKYRSVRDSNKSPSQYFEHTKKSREKASKVKYALQLFLLLTHTPTKVEGNENAVSFGESVADKLEELCQHTIEEVLEKFAETDSQVEETYAQLSGAMQGEVKILSSPKDQEKAPGNISISPQYKQYLVRKIAQDVLRFVWFKQNIINEEPTLYSSFLPGISPEFRNNLRIAVWMQTFRCDLRFKGFLGNNFNRMTSSAELFAKYVSYACYTFKKDNEPVHERFFNALSIVTYFTLRCWEKGSKAFLNTTVELFYSFYEGELLKNFEDKGFSKDFNEFLENHPDLPKYKSLMDDNILLSEYLEQIKDEHEKHDKVVYALQLNHLNEVSGTSVECYEKVILFGDYVADKLKELCKLTFDEILQDFTRIDSQLKEISRQIVGESSGVLESELDPICLRKCPTPENILSSPSTEKELVLQMSTASNSSEILADLDKSGNQVKGIYLETVQDSSEALEREVEQVSSLQGHEEAKHNIPSRSKSKKQELLLKIRKITQDVMMYVWFKHSITKEEPVIIWAPSPLKFPFKLPLKFIVNFRISVWIQSLRNAFKWKGFSNRHFQRMTSTAELFANYVSYACYTSIEYTTNAFACFLDVMSLVTYFTIHCWEKRFEEYLNTSVELVCFFFEHEFLEAFEDQEDWFDFNDYLEANFALAKYESLMKDDIRLLDYFKKPNVECVEDSESFYTSQSNRNSRVTDTEVETHEKAVSFAASIADELEELCQDALDSIIQDFPKTESAVDEICIKNAAEAAGGLTRKGHVSSLKGKEAPENVSSSLCFEKKELVNQVRKVTENVQLFVWYEYKIIKEEPTQYLSFIPNITPEFVNNLRIAVSMHTFRNAFKWKGFLEGHFKRMTSTAELFAKYVYFACYKLIHYARDEHTVFFETLSFVTYLVLFFWDKGYKEFINTSVELVCTFFEKELCENFEDQGGWKAVNEYLVTHFDLMNYKSPLDNNVSLTKYLNESQSKHEENLKSDLSLQCRGIVNFTRSEVEINIKAINFAESVEDKMEQLCLQSLEEIIKDFDLTGHRLGEISQQTVGDVSGGLAREVDISSENIGAQENIQVGDMNQQTVEEASGGLEGEVNILSENIGPMEDIQVGEMNKQTVEAAGGIAKEVDDISENVGALEHIQVGDMNQQTVGEASGGLAREGDISSEKVVTPEQIQVGEMNLQTVGEDSGGLTREVDTSENVGAQENIQVGDMNQQTAEASGGLAKEVYISSKNLGSPENLKVSEMNQQTVGEASGGLTREVDTSSENVVAKENIQVGDLNQQTVEASGRMAREVDDISENVVAPEDIPSETKSEVKEQLQQMIKSHCSDLQNTLPIEASAQVTPRSERVKQLLDDINKDYSELEEVIKDICEKHGV